MCFFIDDLFSMGWCWEDVERMIIRGGWRSILISPDASGNDIKDFFKNKKNMARAKGKSPQALRTKFNFIDDFRLYKQSKKGKNLRELKRENNRLEYDTGLRK